MFKVGDKVKLLRKVDSWAEGWRDVWVSSMDENVGKVGEIIRLHPKLNGAAVKFDNGSAWDYPVVALELFDGLVIGARVRVNYMAGSGWNYEGIITRFIYVDKNPVVRMLAGPYRNDEGGFQRNQLTLLPSVQNSEVKIDPATTVVLKPKLFAPALAPASIQSDTYAPLQTPPGTGVSSGYILGVAKNIARRLAIANSIKRVTADQVQAELAKYGYSIGNAAGQIFKGSKWRNTGITVRSNRESNRSRKISVWEYVG
jgi:hypothetical protein